MNKATKKLHKLYNIAKATLSQPKGTVEDVVFPAASREWLQAVINEVEKNITSKTSLISAIHSSYGRHYRRIMPIVFKNIQFRTTSQDQSLMLALMIIKNFAESDQTCFPAHLTLPMQGIVPKDWMMLVVDRSTGAARVNRIAYEVCVLMTGACPNTPAGEGLRKIVDCSRRTWLRWRQRFALVWESATGRIISGWLNLQEQQRQCVAAVLALWPGSYPYQAAQWLLLIHPLTGGKHWEKRYCPHGQLNPQRMAFAAHLADLQAVPSSV